MSKITILAVLFVGVFVSSCSTTANYDAIVKSWVGIHVDELILQWGPPDKEAGLSGGGKVISYHADSKFRKEENPGSKGLGFALGYKFGEWLMGENPPPGCRTTFRIGSNGIILSYKFIGTACRAKESDKATKSAKWKT